MTSSKLRPEILAATDNSGPIKLKVLSKQAILPSLRDNKLFLKSFGLSLSGWDFPIVSSADLISDDNFGNIRSCNCSKEILGLVRDQSAATVERESIILLMCSGLMP